LTVDKLAHQLLEIKAGLRIANGISSFEWISSPSGREREKLFSDDPPRFDRRNRVRIELDAIVDCQFDLRAIFNESNGSDPADFDAGYFDCRTRFEPRGAVELRLDLVDVTADHVEFPKLNREISKAHDADQHERANDHLQFGFFHAQYPSPL